MTDQTSTEQWLIDSSHSLVEFGIRHLMITTVKGRFGTVEGTVKGSIDDLTNASVEVKIDVGQIDTRDDKRDEHLRSADFFEVERFPQIIFRSTETTKAGNNTYNIKGDLTIRDVTKPITLNATFLGRATDPWGNEKVGFAAQGQLNRKDFGLMWNAPLEAGGFLLADEVTISVEVQANRAS